MPANAPSRFTLLTPPGGWSRRNLAWAGAVAALGIGLVLFALLGSKPRRSPPLQARLELAAGRVTLETGAGSGPVISGAALPTDARVTTASGARALVRLSDGTALFLRDDTSVQLKPDGALLLSGQLWMDAAVTNRKPAVHRAGAVEISAADAGLDLTLKGSEVAVYVARGTAALSAPGGRAEVRAGERATLRGTAAPELAPVAWWEDWTGGMADRRGIAAMAGTGAGTLYGVDLGGPPGSPARVLEVSRQSIRATIREGLAETEVDQTFFNPNERAVEGWYWFTVPSGAQVTGFALETAGRLVEGELIERNEARAQYANAAAAGYDPALLEWVDSRTFRARIHPVPAAGTRRAILRYLQRLPIVEGRLRFVHPLRARSNQQIGEFALSVDLGDAGTSMEIATLDEARIEDGGRRVTMRRSGFRPLADFQLEARLAKPLPEVRVSRFSGGDDSADYLMARWIPEVDWAQLPAQPGEIVLVVDTSADADEAARQLKVGTAEAVLRALSTQDRFALVALDVKPVVLHPAQGLAQAKEDEVTTALDRLAEHAAGGATDLSSLFDVTLARLHGAEQPALVYVGDGWATSGELGGEAIVSRLSRALSTSRARFFAVAVGSEANHGLLSELSRAGGGQLYSVDENDQATSRALELAAAVKTPTMTDLDFDLGAGLDEVFLSSSGKVGRGEEVLLLARTHHDLPAGAKIRGRLAGKPFERDCEITYETSVAASFVPRLWAAEAIRRQLGTAAQPDAARGKVIAMGIEYGLMTPYTSFIALESEEAFQRMGIPRRTSSLRGVRLSSVVDPALERQALAEAGLLAATAAFGCSRETDPSGAAVPVARQGGPNEAKQRATLPLADLGSHLEKASASPAAPPPAIAGGAALAPAAPSAADAFGAPVSPKASRRESALSKGRGEAPKPSEGESPLQIAAPSPSSCGLPSIESACSDLAERPLAERGLVWNQRLRTARSPSELIARYQAARAACELSDWRAESRFLQLLQRQLRTPEAVSFVLGQFACTREAQHHLARLILRRAVDAALVSTVQRALLGDRVDWSKVDLELSAIAEPAKRLELLRASTARAPEDAEGLVRLCRELARAGHAAEALAQARKLRERGLVNPLALREIGDTLAQLGQPEEALRTYSEIVEFDAASPASRRLLGDIFLARGWYDAAYRQYETLTGARANDWSGWLRLASAAAGAGRIDEAVRISRQVAAAEGTPGPADPRRWARLWTAARLAKLIQAPPASAGDPKKIVEGMKRELKELQLLQAPGAWVIVTWEDLAVDLAVSLEGDSPGDGVDAATVGLGAVQLELARAGGARPVARFRGGHRSGPVKLVRHDIAWDGKAFQIKQTEAMLAESAETVALF